METKLRNIQFSSDGIYRSRTENEPFTFYLDALSNSIRLDLLLGYFSSSAINVLSLGFASFLFNGGKMRVIANNVLSEEDAKAIKNAQDIQKDSQILDLRNIMSLRYSLDEYNTHFFNCISWLIANHRIEILLIKPKSGKGIAHYKSGVFYDSFGAKVQFKASCNFTYYGLLENLEELDINISWDQHSTNKIASYEFFFQELFEKKSELVEYITADEVLKNISETYPLQSIEKLLIDEKTLIEKKTNFFKSESLKKSLKKITNLIESRYKEPRFPDQYSEGIRPYQQIAFEKWVTNNYTGIFAMATGTGKTVTSLNCLLNIFKKTGSYRSVILVPTVALLTQWKKECYSFNFKNLVLISSSSDWMNEISILNTSSKFSEKSFVIIVTYASFSKTKFQAVFENLPADTVLIADEMHNMGAPKLIKNLYKIHLKNRLGLSATPLRKYDTDSNDVLNSFFNDKPPYLFEFSMEQALDEGRLCKYNYFPHVVELTSEESIEYRKYSIMLMRFLDTETGKYKDSQEVRKLLLKRKNIINKASRKIRVFEQVIKDIYIQNNRCLNYTLVYVPEGRESDYSRYDEYIEDDIDNRLINEYTAVVRNLNNSIIVRQYTSLSADRDSIIESFSHGKTDVLTSMKCLDEGVDIPRSEIAIFCASSGNPRQFIQRRGRVLRNHPAKIKAQIHDLIVIPCQSDNSAIDDIDKKLLKNELLRVIDFANMALNKIHTFTILKPYLEKYNLNLYNL